MNFPNQPAFAFNAPAPAMPSMPPAPVSNPNNFPPTMATAAPLVPDYAAQARELLRAKVLVDSKPLSTPQMVEWVYAEIAKRMGGGVNIDKRMCEGLSSSPVGAINLGNDNEESLTTEQRQAKILELIPTKLTWKGAVCAGTADYLGQVLGWMLQNIPSVSSLADQAQKMVALHNWMRNLPNVYELDDATRAALVQQAPMNPVSDQITPQIAQPVAVVPPAPIVPAEGEANNEPEDPILDPVDGYKCKNLRGLKTRVTRTHKSDFGAFCTQYGLDPLTGRKNGTVAPVGGPVAPITPPPSSQPLPALVGMGAPVGTPSVPALPITTVGTVSSGIVMPVMQPTNNPPALYDANGQPTPAYAAAMAAANGNQAMPVPPASQPTTPVSFVPSFTPTVATPAPVVPAAPPVSTAVAFQPTQSTQGALVANAAPPAMGWSAPAAATGIPVGLDRAAMAKMLGGSVNLIVVRLLEINLVNLGQCIDVNQLAMLAEKSAREELRILDLAQAQYGSGKQAAQRHFADLLTKYPNCYLLMNGFEFILPAGFLEILIARTVYVYHVSDRGGNVEIKL